MTEIVPGVVDVSGGNLVLVVLVKLMLAILVVAALVKVLVLEVLFALLQVNAVRCLRQRKHHLFLALKV